MYKLLPTHLYPKTLFIKPDEPFGGMVTRVREAGFAYPFCTKPDVGMKGLLFRKIDSEADLQQYHQQMPVAYMVQELVQYGMEVSVFYYRHPDKERGVISGFIQKELMEVAGDGERTLLQLIQAHPKAKHREAEMSVKHAEMLEQILPAGEKVQLAHAANLSRGARFINLRHLIDEALLQVFDGLSHATQFYYGRYDIKCNSVADLKMGRNFSILEFNGSGAEPNHVYNSGFSLFAAQAVFLHHWKVLYEISKYNHNHGVRYWPFLRGWKFMRAAKRHLRVLERYDTKIPL